MPRQPLDAPENLAKQTALSSSFPRLQRRAAELGVPEEADRYLRQDAQRREIAEAERREKITTRLIPEWKKRVDALAEQKNNAGHVLEANRMKFKIVIAGVVALAAIPAFIAAQLALRPAQWFMIEHDALDRAAAIVMLNGDVQRLKEVIRLYREGWAREVWLIQDPKSSSNDVPPPIRDPGTRRNCKTLIESGIPRASTLVLLASGTRAELTRMAEELRRRGASTAIVVTSPYNTRRVRFLWDTHVGSRLKAIVRGGPTTAPPDISSERVKFFAARLRLDAAADLFRSPLDGVPTITDCGAAH